MYLILFDHIKVKMEMENEKHFPNSTEPCHFQSLKKIGHYYKQAKPVRVFVKDIHACKWYRSCNINFQLTVRDKENC